MKRLTEAETAVVKHFHITPENIHNFTDFSGLATFCMHEGYPEAYDKISAGLMLMGIEKKFWDDEGFDALSLEDVAGWVLTTYLTKEEVITMCSDEIISKLQDWKYYCGFRKKEGWGEHYRSIALQIWDGTIIQKPDDEDIFYVEKEEE